MSLRDFNEPSQPIGTLHTDPSGNSAGLNAFHTIHPEERAPNNTPKIVGALAVALMVGAAGIGLYAYSGSSSQPKPVVADNNLPQPPAAASAPIAPPPQQAADNSAPAPAATDNTPAPTPVKEASAKPVKHRMASNTGSTQTSSDASSVRMNADSTQASQAPAQQAAIAPSATPLPAAPQPSPSDVASNNSQASQPVQSAAPDATAQQPSAPVEQAGTPPAQ
jgi:hypothetical protein